MGGVNTPHPKEGDSKHASAPPPAPHKVKAMLAKLADLPKQAEEKAKTERELRADLATALGRIRELERQDKQAAPAPIISKNALTDGDRLQLRNVIADFQTFQQSISSKSDEAIARIVEQTKLAVEDAAKTLMVDAARMKDRFADRMENPRLIRVIQKLEAANETTVHFPNGSSISGITRINRAPEQEFRGGNRGGGKTRMMSGSSDLPPGELKILTAAASYANGVERSNLTVLAGYKKSSRDVYISRLVGRGLVAIMGGKIAATTEGVAALGPHFRPLPTGKALYEWWSTRLPSGELTILAFLMSHRGQWINRDQITTSTNYKKSSRDVYISRLSSRGLVETGSGGSVRAAAQLFDR